MGNREKFLKLVSKEKTNTAEKNKNRIKNRLSLKERHRLFDEEMERLERELDKLV